MLPGICLQKKPLLLLQTVQGNTEKNKSPDQQQAASKKHYSCYANNR
jgi:hypothetical protein